jgi:rsbT co-antagonist protein RsbR
MREDTPQERAAGPGEIERLQERVAELERALQEERRGKALLQQVLDALPYAVFWKGRDLVYLGANQLFAVDAGRAPQDIAGRTDHEMAWSEIADKYRGDDREVMDLGRAKPVIIEPIQRGDGSEGWVETCKVPLIDEAGEVFGMVGVYADVTDRKREEEAMALRRESLIADQAELLSALSTPLLPIQEQVLVMPLIGTIDEARSQRVMERLLEGITEQQAETVILDLTGVPQVDASVASGVLASAKAAELLGARVILTGIRPELARAIVELNVDLGKTQTFGTLRDGVAHATRMATRATAGRSHLR